MHSQLDVDLSLVETQPIDWGQPAEPQANVIETQPKKKSASFYATSSTAARANLT